MLNYIKAELYRNFNRMYFWVYTGTLSILGLLMNILISHNTSMTVNQFVETLYPMFAIGIFLVVCVLDFTTAEEQKNQTFKNVVSFGIPRYQLFLSKVIVGSIFGIISMAIILSVFLGSAILLFGFAKSISLALIGQFMIRLLVATLLWIAALCIGTFLSIFFKNSTQFSIVYAVMFLLVSPFFKLLTVLVSDKFKYITNILITTQFDNLAGEVVTNTALVNSSLVAIGYIIISSIIGIIYTNKKEF